MICKNMFFHAMAKPQDAGLVRHLCKLFKLRKLKVNRGVKESFLDGRV